MEKLKRYWAIILIFIILVIGWFYWFQLRPAEIRHHCSWVSRVSPATPAQPEITKEEAAASKLEYDKCIKNYSGNQNTWSALNNLAHCGNLLKQEQRAVPAKPETEYYQKANINEYNFCVHENGL